MKKNIVKTLNAGTFDIDYCFVLTDDEKFINNFAKEQGYSEDDIKDLKEFYGLTYTDAKNNLMPIIWVRQKDLFSPKWVGILSHEIAHLAIYILCEWTDVAINPTTDEVLGHLIEKITKDIISVIYKEKKKIKIQEVNKT